MLLVGVVLFTFIVNQISTENSGKFEASASRHFFNIYISYQLPACRLLCVSWIKKLYHVCGLASSIYLYTDVEIISQQVVWFVYAFYNRRESSVLWQSAHIHNTGRNNGLRLYTLSHFISIQKIFFRPITTIKFLSPLWTINEWNWGEFTAQLNRSVLLWYDTSVAM